MPTETKLFSFNYYPPSQMSAQIWKNILNNAIDKLAEAEAAGYTVDWYNLLIETDGDNYVDERTLSGKWERVTTNEVRMTVNGLKADD